MRGQPWSAERDAQLREYVLVNNPTTAADWQVCGTVLKCSGHAARQHWSLIKNQLVKEPDTFASPVGPSPLSEAEMVRLFSVDLTRWEVTRLSHNTWQQGSKGPDGELCHQPLYQTTIHLKRIPGADSLESLATSLLETLKQPKPSGPILLRHKSDYLLEIDPADLHLGKLGWHPETESGDYDLTIARRQYREAFDDLMAKTVGFKANDALFVIGNDLLHTDNARSETTAGTRVDSDSRYHKTFNVAVDEMRWGVERLKQRCAKVVLKVVRGNHDFFGTWNVGRVLEAVYENDPQVVIDNTPALRKYHRFGATLFGYTHGSEEKHADLPLIMAQERPQDWAETEFRLVRVGHLHTKRSTRYTAADSIKGVEVRVLRSLSGVDAWHYQKGYVKERRAIEAFVHHIADGEVGAFVSRLPTQP